MGEDSDKYSTAFDYVEQSDEKDELLRLQVVSCSLTYAGKEIDISDCKVTAKITSAETLNDQAKESIPVTVKQILGEEKAAEIGEEVLEKKTGIMLKAMKINDTEVDSIGDTYLNQHETEAPIAGSINAHNEKIAMAALAKSNVQFTVQYYAYAQILEDKQTTGAEAITIINTSIREGEKGKAQQTPIGKVIG